MQTISATELARNTREVLDKVASRGETVIIERNHTMIAQIMPPTQAAAWLKDSKGDFVVTKMIDSLQNCYYNMPHAHRV